MWTDDDSTQEFVLKHEGDFIAWEPGNLHTWEAVGDTTMLTISFRGRG